MKKLFKKILFKIRKLLGMESMLILLGKHLIEMHKNIKDIYCLERFEFKVFSQWGEDGIIQFLIRQIEIPNKIFVEFGVEDYTEATTKFLLINDNWNGLVMDSSKSNIDFIKKDSLFWKHDLKAVCNFITKDNINQLISDNIEEKDIGILSIDIDGNDYWIWKAINVVEPRIVVCEYNGIFGCEHFITVPYEDNFNRSRKHYSHLYWGASLPALCFLAEQKGYVFVGCNSNGNNAFFIRKDICLLPAVNYKDRFVMPKFRESRDCNGKLSFLGGKDRIHEIYEMEIFNIKTKFLVLIKDVFFDKTHSHNH